MDTLTGFTSTYALASEFVSVSTYDEMVALGNGHTRSVPSLSSLPKVALEAVAMFV